MKFAYVKRCMNPDLFIEMCCCAMFLLMRKEMFYLTMHSTHFIYGYMVKDHSDSEKGNPLPPQLAAWVLLYAPSHRQDSTCHNFCYTSHGTLAGTRKLNGFTLKDRSNDPSHHEQTLLPQSYISLPC